MNELPATESEQRLATDGGHEMPPDEDDFRHGIPISGGETTRFESADGSHEITVTIPADRKHLSGLLDAMDEMDKRAHRAGYHDDDPREDCPLCPDSEGKPVTDGGLENHYGHISEYVFNPRICDLIEDAVEETIEAHTDCRKSYTDEEYQQHIHTHTQPLLFGRITETDIEGYGIENLNAWIANQVAIHTNPWEQTRDKQFYNEWTHGDLSALLYYSLVAREWVARLDDTSAEGNPRIDRETGEKRTMRHTVDTMMAAHRDGNLS